MTHRSDVSPRSLITAAGASAAALVAVMAATTVSPPAASRAPIAAPIVVASPSIQLSAVTSAGSFVKTAYDTAEPWVAYGFEIADYALSFVPVLWWVAPGIDLAYFTIEPLVQAAVYSFADLIDLDFAQIGPDIQAGITEATQNFFDYAAQWIATLIPFPPLPPLPPSPPLLGASVANTRAPAAATTQATEAVPGAPAADRAPGTAGPTTVSEVDPDGAAAAADTEPATSDTETTEPATVTTEPAAEPATEAPEPAAVDEKPRAERLSVGRAGRAAPAPAAAASTAGQPAGADRGYAAGDRPAVPARSSARTR